MATMTLAIPDVIREDMKHFSEVKWSEVARKAITEKLNVLKLAEKLAKKSKLTKTDVEEFSEKIKARAAKQFLG